MKRLIYLFIIVLAFVSCNRDLHDKSIDLPTDMGMISVTLNNDYIGDAPLKDVHLYWFNETDQLYQHDYYKSMEDLGLARLALPNGSYTVIAVLNVGADFTIPNTRSELPNIDLLSFSKYIKEQAEKFDNMFTGTLRNILDHGFQLLTIDLLPKAEGVIGVNYQLLITIPSANLPDFITTRLSLPHLRGTAHVFKKGERELFTTKRAILEATIDPGVYKMNLSLFEGEFDVNLWVDWVVDNVEDHHYITTHDKGDVMRILPKKDYNANDDNRDAFSKRISIALKNEGNEPLSIDMHRPLAKYKLVATDVEKYNSLREYKGLPELKDLQVFIGYEGFFPSAYTISEQKPADAEGGYYYNTILGYSTPEKVDVAKDFVFVNGAESSVSVTILFKDLEGNIVSGVKGVKIQYRAGQLTTVSGNFLTSGIGSGVDINTEWDDDINVEF